MKVIVKLKVNPDVPIPFDNCYPTYDSEEKEVIICNRNEDAVEAVYDLDVLTGEIIWVL